ncbi:MAG TPA: amidohydrolase family protein [Acidimicrobiales bacterium]|nr:amidohydrolase family protein [Acidimicrobiales bacterium]
MAEHDLIISGGTIVDGTGAPPVAGDVAVTGDRITAVGRVEGGARRVIEAGGAIVTPGFVDIHSHYDGQATWDERMVPSAWHGVTTVVMGNCGVGFAPCRPDDRDRLIELMEGVEDIPGTALHEGIPWAWTSFPEYLDHLDARSFDIDVAAQVPHGAVRLYVMGERGARREVAEPDEIAEMGRIAREGVAAGALGFTTSRTTNHRTSRGEPTPTLTASVEELVGIASAIGGAGVLQVVSDFSDLDAEFATMRRMVAESGCPLSISVAAEDHRAPWRDLRDRIAGAAADGLPVRGQVGARAIGVLLGLQATLNPFVGVPAYREVATRSLEERVGALRDPGVRATILAQAAEGPPGLLGMLDRVFELGDPPDYEPHPDRSLARRAERQGCTSAELAYDLLLADDGQAFLYLPFHNWVDGSLDAVREMLADEHLVPGLADGGAHVGTICDASYPTTLLAHWARDRAEGLPLEWVVRRQCRDTAETVGLRDRGVLAPGMKADVNVVDHAGLCLRPPYMAFDLPAGGKRLLQRADGYLHTFVSGVETYAGGEALGPLPGRLVRGPQGPSGP